MTSKEHWIAGARPKTLPAAFAPVLIGSAIAVWNDAFAPLVALLALLVALALQIGVNYANDYSDGVRGTDEVRVGPIRLVGQGLAPAAAVKRAAFLSFGVAALAGLVLTLLTSQWVFIPVGVLAIVSAWFYTGGSNPYGYLGLGEVFVFVWFGLAAVIGTAYAQTEVIDGMTIILAVGSGSYACALLVVNNLRDIPGDTVVGKRTLAVRLGDAKTRLVYVALVWVGFGSSIVIGGYAIVNGESTWPVAALAGAVSALAAHVPGQAVLKGASGRDLIAVLAGTGKAQMIWAVTTSAGIIAQSLLR